MRFRKIRIVADSCPLHRKNCDTCRYCNGLENSKVYCYYGDKDWKTELSMGFSECFRVLEPYGVLIFKWAETQLKLKTVLALTDQKPLFGHRRGKTFWVAFMKFPKNMKGE